MPKSRVRKKAAFTPPPKKLAKNRHGSTWVAPTMLVFFLLGMGWLVAYYLTNGATVPFSEIPAGADLGIGFGAILIGFGLATQWR